MVTKVVIFNKVVIRFQQIWLEKTDIVMKVKQKLKQTFYKSFGYLLERSIEFLALPFFEIWQLKPPSKPTSGVYIFLFQFHHEMKWKEKKTDAQDSDCSGWQIFSISPTK